MNIQFQGQKVEADAIPFEAMAEPWAELRCVDGTVIRLRIIVTQILRLRDRVNEQGQPVYLVNSTNAVSVTPHEE